MEEGVEPSFMLKRWLMMLRDQNWAIIGHLFGGEGVEYPVRVFLPKKINC